MLQHRTIICFQVEIGGIRGKVLTQAVQKIHETFREIYAVFGNRLKSKSHIDPFPKNIFQAI